jgi:hypothetical protein
MYLNFKLQIKIVKSKWEFTSGTYLQGFKNYTKFYNFLISSQVYILVPKFAHVMFTSSIVVKDKLVITCGVCLIPESKIIYYYLGSMLLHITKDDQSTQKKFDLVKIKFHMNDNI